MSNDCGRVHYLYCRAVCAACEVTVAVCRYHERIASKSEVIASTSFFLPDVDARLQEREYGRLQQCAERSTGFPPIESRIERLSCRIGGKDCTVEVGGTDPVDGTTVVAILDLGRHLPYGVFTTADPDAPAHLVGKRIYSLTTFTS